MPPKSGKYICPDCRKDIGKSVKEDSTPCKSCGKRICNYCHVAQKELCRACKGTSPQKTTQPERPQEKKKKKKGFFVF